MTALHAVRSMVPVTQPRVPAGGRAMAARLRTVIAAPWPQPGRRLRALVAALVAATGLVAAAAPPASAADAPDTRHGLLWRIERPGVAASHLFGTLHVDDPRVLALRPEVVAALAGARQLLLELVTDDDSGPRFEAASTLPDGTDLRGLLGAPAFDRVAAQLAAEGVPAARALQLKPWAAYLLLSRPAGPQGETLDAALGRLAQARGTPVAGLERLDEQIASIESVPLASQCALLDATALRRDAVQAGIERLVERYLAEDLDGIARLERQVGTTDDGADGDTADDPALRTAQDDLIDRLVRRRNPRMLARMAPALARGGAFVAVGALHLQGDDGLLALLQQAGWQVRRAPSR